MKRRGLETLGIEDMESQNPTIESFIDHAEGFSVFMGASEPDARDRFFLVMGLTGAGKSTFIRRCVNADVVVGHGLQSCECSSLVRCPCS